MPPVTASSCLLVPKGLRREQTRPHLFYPRQSCCDRIALEFLIKLVAVLPRIAVIFWFLGPSYTLLHNRNTEVPDGNLHCKFNEGFSPQGTLPEKQVPLGGCDAKTFPFMTAINEGC